MPSTGSEQPDSASRAPAADAGFLPVRNMAGSLVLIAIFAVLIYAALLFYGDFDATVEAAARLDGMLVVEAALLSCANYALRALRWHHYLRMIRLQVPFVDSVRVFLAGFAMTVTPAKAGEIIKSVLLKRSYGHAISTTAPVVLAERVTDLAGLVLLIAVGSLAFSEGALLASVSGALVVVMLAMSASKSVGRWTVAVCRRLPVIRSKADRLVLAFDSLHALSTLRALCVAVPLSTLAWSLQGAALWRIAGGFEVLDVSFQESLFAYSMPLVAGTLAMLPGGLGLAEGSMTAVLVRLSPGAPAAVPAAVTILVRLVTFWLAVAIGWLSLLLWRLRWRGRTIGTP